jgi:hypothetical protein
MSVSCEAATEMTLRAGTGSLRQKILSLHRCAAADLPITAALQLHLLVLLETKNIFSP